MFSPLEISKTGLTESTIKLIQNSILKFKEIEKVIIYGSRAKGTFRNGSDIDLCLFGDNVNSETVLRLETVLDDLLTPYTFDICIYKSIDDQNLKDHIERVGLIFLKP